MAGELAEAAVEIIADIDDFDDDLRRRLQESAREAANDVERELGRVNEAARRAGRFLADEIGEGSEEARRSIEQIARVAEQAERAMEDLDPDELDRIAEEARQASGELGELARRAREAEGEFEGMDPERLRRIAQEADRAADEMDEIGRAAQRAAREVERLTDPEEMERLAREAERAQRQLDRLGRTRFQNMRNEARQAGRAIFRAFSENGEAARRELERIDNTRFREVVRRAQEAARGIRRAFRDAGENDRLGKSLKRIGTGFRRLLLAAASVAALTAALAGLTHAVVVLVGVLAPSLGLLAGIPAAVLLGVAAFATLKVALAGVGDAFKAALSGEDLEEKLKDLAPAAQKVVREVAKLRPALLKLRKSVQGAFFKPLVGELKAVAANLLGPLRTAMSATAAQFGRLATGATRFGRSAEAVRLVNALFGQLRDQLAGIKTSTITGLLDAISHFTRATLPGFDNLGSAIDGALGRLTRFLDRSAASGKALQWLEQGKAQARALGSLLADLGRIVFGVGKAMVTASEGALGWIGRLADGLAEFANSAKGQAQLVAVFRAVNAVASQTLPVIEALIGGLAQLAPTASALVAELGPALVSAIGAVVPALEGIGQGLIPLFAGIREAIDRIDDSGALGQLGRAIGDLLAAAAPLAPAIGDVLVSAFRSLAVAAAAIAPILRVVASALAAVASSPLGAALGPLVAQLALVRLVTGSWSTALKSLVPVLKLVGKAALYLGRSLLTLIAANPVVAVIVGLAAGLVLLLSQFQAVRDAVSRFTHALQEGFSRLKAFGSSLLNTFRTEGPVAALRQLGSAIIDGLGAAITRAARLAPRLLEGLLSGLVSAISAVPNLLRQLGDAVSAGLQRIADEAPRVARELADGLRDAWRSLREQGPEIAAALKQALRQALDALRTEGPRVKAALGDLLRTAFAALTTYGPELARQAGNAFKSVNATLFRLAASGLRQAGDALADNLPGLATKVADLLSRLIIRGGEALAAAINKLAERIRGGLDKAVGQAATGTSSESGGGAKLKKSLVDLLIDVGVAFLDQVVKLTPLIVQALQQLGRAVIGAAITVTPQIVNALGNLLLALAGAMLVKIVGFLSQLPARLLAALTPLSTQMAMRGQQAMLGLLRGLVARVPSILTYLASLPGRMASALLSLPGKLAAKAQQAMSQMRNRFSIGGGSSQALMATFPSRFAGALSSLAGKLAAKGQEAMSRLRGRLESGGSSAVATVRRLADRIPGGLAGLPGRMASIGAAVMQGFISGVRSKAGAIADSVLAPIRNAISATRSLLDVGSPSKVFAEIGRFVGEGLVVGLERQDPHVAAAAADLMERLTGAFGEVSPQAGPLAGAAGRLGERAARLLYAAGDAAGEGFVDGLVSRRKEIVDVMVDIAEQVARAVRDTLRIGSPSRVMRGLGSDTLAGFLAGLEAMAPQIERALADAVRIPSVRIPDLSGGRSAGRGALADREPGGRAEAIRAVPRPRSSADVAAQRRAADRMRAAEPRTVRQTEVNAPVTVNMPVADPDAVGQVVSSRIAAKVAR